MPSSRFACSADRAETHKLRPLRIAQGDAGSQYRGPAPNHDHLFREEEVTFRDKAAAEDRNYELYDRMPGPSKYPTRADTARAFRDYHLPKAK